MDNRSDKRNKRLQALCRNYLRRLRHIAEKHGLGDFIRETIQANKRNECEATNYEVALLSRCVDDERISRSEIPQVLGKSYRECIDANDFEKIGKLRHVGTYSKVSALLLAAKQKKHKK